MTSDSQPADEPDEPKDDKQEPEVDPEAEVVGPDVMATRASQLIDEMSFHPDIIKPPEKGNRYG
jgi:hypothetical protein